MAMLASSTGIDAIPDFLKPEYALPARRPSRVEGFPVAAAAVTGPAAGLPFGKGPTRRAAMIQSFQLPTSPANGVGTDPNLASTAVKTSGSLVPKEKLSEERASGIWGAALFKTFISNKLGKVSSIGEAENRGRQTR